MHNDGPRDRRLNPEGDLQITGLRLQSAIAQNSAAYVSHFNTQRSEQFAALNTFLTNVAALELKAPVTGNACLPPSSRPAAAPTCATGTVPVKSFLRGQDQCHCGPQQGRGRPGAYRSQREFRLYSLLGEPFYGKVTKPFVARTEELPNSVMAGRFGGDVPTQIDLNGREEP